MPATALALDVQPISRLFKALGDETRVRIIALLSHGELCVCHLEKALGLSQPNVSRQLSVLRAARVVEPRRDGTWVYYRLAEQDATDCDTQLQSLVESFARNAGLGQDVKRLIKSCGPKACT